MMLAKILFMNKGFGYGDDIVLYFILWQYLIGDV